MAVRAHAVIRFESAIPERFFLHEITDSYNLLQHLRYAILNDKFTPDDLKTAMSFGERVLVAG
jgi:hypothetical protein